MGLRGLGGMLRAVVTRTRYLNGFGGHDYASLFNMSLDM